MIHRIGALMGAAVAMLVTYICVSGSASLGELLYGAMVTLLGTLAMAAAVRLAGVRQWLEAKWLVRLGKPAMDVVIQIVPLSGTLVASVASGRNLCATLSERRFDPGEDEDPVAAGRRALVAVGLSIAPASLICERDLDCGELTVAAIGLKPPPENGVDPCWPL